MSPEALATALIVSAALGLIFGYIIGKTRADGIAFDERDAARRERDAALQAKSAQFETWQAEAQNLRADVAALERENEALKRECRDATDLSIAAQREAEAAQRELALLRPIADSAERLLDDEKFPGEWADARAAIRARKEAKP